VFCMERDEIQFLCHSNPEAIVDHIESLVIELNETKIESNEFKAELNKAKIELNDVKAELNDVKLELNEAKEEIRNLKALLNQNSQNSNKPPSTDLFVKKKAKREQKESGRRPGGQKGHPGSTLKTFDSPHEIVNHRLCNCKFCGHDL
jgi:chromosome segregation ATPase